jgi:thioester reductase-like protein
MMTTLAQTCMLLKAVPDLDVAVDLVPVDFVSRAIVTMAQQLTTHNAYHLANPHPAHFSDVVAFLEAQGIVVEAIPFDVWRERVVDLAQQYGMDNPYLSLLEEVSAEQIFMPAIDCSNTLQALRNTEIACPPVDSRLLTTYLQHLQGTRSE